MDWSGLEFTGEDWSADRKGVEGVRGDTGCSSTREARVTEGLKMPPEVAVEEEVEEEEMVTVQYVAG